MKMIQKKRLSLVFVLVMVFIMAACSGNNDNKAGESVPPLSEEGTSPAVGETANADTSEAEKQNIIVTDQYGREITIEGPVERILCMQHHTLDIILELQAQDLVVGTMNSWENLLGSYIRDIFPEIDDLPKPGEMKEYNIEEVMALEPDVIFASNQIPEDTLTQLEKFGIPVIVITLYKADREQASTIAPELINPDEAYTEGLKQTIEIIAEVTGKEERGQELWDYVVTNRQIVADHLETVPEDKRILVYMANEDMYTYGTGKYVGVAMEKAGAKNVAETIKGYQQVTIEQIIEWNPEVIFVQSRYAEVLDEIQEDERWASIDAVKKGNLFIAPDYTKPWGNPAPESIALGELWLAKTLYPDTFEDVDLDEMVSYFYSHFYGIEYTAK